MSNGRSERSPPIADQRRKPGRTTLFGSLAAGFALVMVAAAMVPAASAAASIHISGAFVFTFTSESVIVAGGGNTYIHFTFSESFSGSVTGTRVGAGTLILNANGHLVVADAGTFVGSVNGIFGACVGYFAGGGTLVSLSGYAVLTGCSGGLTGAHGWAAVTGGATSAITIAGTYSGQVS